MLAGLVLSEGSEGKSVSHAPPPTSGGLLAIFDVPWLIAT